MYKFLSLLLVIFTFFLIGLFSEGCKEKEVKEIIIYIFVDNSGSYYYRYFKNAVKDIRTIKITDISENLKEYDTLRIYILTFGDSIHLIGSTAIEKNRIVSEVRKRKIQSTFINLVDSLNLIKADSFTNMDKLFLYIRDLYINNQNDSNKKIYFIIYSDFKYDPNPRNKLKCPNDLCFKIHIDDFDHVFTKIQNVYYILPPQSNLYYKINKEYKKNVRILDPYSYHSIAQEIIAKLI